MKHLIAFFLLFGALSSFSQEEIPMPEIAQEIEDTVEVEAEFPGGASAMMRWISENVNYPEEAIEMGEQGRVYVQFVVERDGSISNVAIVRGVSPSIDFEVKRLIKSMPTWSPGRVDNKPVRTRCTLPVNFKLDIQESDKKKKRRNK